MTKPHTHRQNSRNKSFVKSDRFDNVLLWLIAILLITIATYRSVTRFDLVGWDDKLYVKETPIVQGLTMENVKAMFTQKVLLSYNPLVLLSFAAEYEITHLDPKW